MLHCKNIVLLTIRIFGVAKFSTQTSLSLLMSCKLSFLTVGLKISFIPSFALESHNKLFMCFCVNL
jgi:NADH:ubiquinone oxidoreductase subunit K